MKQSAMIFAVILAVVVAVYAGFPPESPCSCVPYPPPESPCSCVGAPPSQRCCTSLPLALASGPPLHPPRRGPALLVLLAVGWVRELRPFTGVFAVCLPAAPPLRSPAALPSPSHGDGSRTEVTRLLC